MNMMSKIALLVFGGVVSLAVAAQNRNLITGKTIDYDHKTGHTTILDARISLDEKLVITARNASFTVDENETPRAIELSSGVKFQIGNKQGTADRATFYPELDLLSSRQITLLGDQSPSAVISYTCQAGTLYANGTSTGGGSVCLGFTEIGCTGAGGNSVYMVRLRYACGAR